MRAARLEKLAERSGGRNAVTQLTPMGCGVGGRVIRLSARATPGREPDGVRREADGSHRVRLTQVLRIHTPRGADNKPVAIPITFVGDSRALPRSPGRASPLRINQSRTPKAQLLAIRPGARMLAVVIQNPEA